MKINSISNIFNSRRINNPQPSNRILANTLKADTFVKSIEQTQMSPVSHLEDKYSAIKKDMTEYIMNSEEISIDGIRKITKKYCPDFNVADIKQAPNRSNINISTYAYTYEPVMYANNNGKIKVVEMPKTVYLNLPDSNHPFNNSEKVILLSSTLHELTHALQSTSDDRTSLFDVAQSFCDRSASIEETVPTLKAFNPVFNYTELNILKALVTAFPSISDLPKEINQRTDIDSCFMNKFKMTSFTFAKNVLNSALSNAMSQGLKIDKNAVLDYTIVKSQHEVEAYQKSLESDKEQLGLSGKTDFDLRIELYNSVIRAATSLKDSE